MFSAIDCSAGYRGARKTQGSPSTVSGITTSSAISWAMAASITSTGMSSSFAAKRHQLRIGQSAVALRRGFCQRIGDPGLGAQRRV